eukprot:1176988-Prorocentrum_minimum.AAC.2
MSASLPGGGLVGVLDGGVEVKLCALERFARVCSEGLAALLGALHEAAHVPPHHCARQNKAHLAQKTGRIVIQSLGSKPSESLN